MSASDLPAQISGRYRPIRLIGKGGMGAVYEVEHVHTGQRLALKVLTLRPEASIERFKREARAAAGIPSDHVVRVTDADVAPELDGLPFLVMELLDGADLGRVTGDRPASPAAVIEWLRQVARALVKAHDRGIVHRDLKPENLFLTHREDGTPLVKILDFGVAKFVADGAGLTHSDQFLGTPLYMAPEQADSHGPPITPRADLYALGLTAFKLLTGHSYWGSGSLAQILAQILAGPMPPPSARGSAFGPAFDAWFMRACDRDPRKRFSSADEQIEQLAVALGLPRVTRISDATPKADSPESTLPSALSPTPTASATDLESSRSRIGRKGWLLGAIAGGIGGIAALAALSRPALEPTSPTAASARRTGNAEAGPAPSAASALPLVSLDGGSSAVDASSASIPSASANPTSRRDSPAAQRVAPIPIADAPLKTPPGARPAASPAVSPAHLPLLSRTVDASMPRDPLQGQQ